MKENLLCESEITNIIKSYYMKHSNASVNVIYRPIANNRNLNGFGSYTLIKVLGVKKTGRFNVKFSEYLNEERLIEILSSELDVKIDSCEVLTCTINTDLVNRKIAKFEGVKISTTPQKSLKLKKN